MTSQDDLTLDDALQDLSNSALELLQNPEALNTDPQVNLPFKPNENTERPNRPDRRNKRTDARTDEITTLDFGYDVHRDKTALAVYLKEIRQYPRLTMHEEVALATAARQGSEEAETAFIASSLRLVVHFALKCRYCGRPIQDLIADGNIGLLTAVRRYDPASGHRFSTYAAPWITGAIKQGLQENCRTIRLPEDIYRQYCKVVNTYALYRQMEGRDPDMAELQSKTGLTEKQIKNVLILPETGSMDTSETDIKDAAETIPETSNPDVSDYLYEALHILTDQEKDIIIHRYELDRKEKQTYQTLAQRYAIARATVVKLEKKALRKMRIYLSGSA